jgi:proteasome lid subunit RPN8/RPN11
MAEHLQKIKDQSENEYPDECCGVLLGVLQNNDVVKTVLEVRPAKNGSKKFSHRDHFFIIPEELIGCEDYAEKNNMGIVGYYHSHIDCQATPSKLDMENAWFAYSYIIVSVHKGMAADIASWVIDDDRSKFTRETIEEGAYR